MCCNAQHFSQLTGLQELTLRNPTSDLDTTLLEGMTRLRQANLVVDELITASQQPLLVFSRLSALQSLQLSCVMKEPVTPAEAAALTTSSHLTHLDVGCLLGDTDTISGHNLQEAHYEAMFPPGRQLQLQLRELQASTALLSSTVDLGQLTSLTSLAVQLHSRETQRLAAGLEKLTASKDLAKLELSASFVDLPAGVWSSLAALTGLRYLTVKCEPPSGQHLLALTSCQHLERLHIPIMLSDGHEVERFEPGYDENLGIQLQVGILPADDRSHP